MYLYFSAFQPLFQSEIKIRKPQTNATKMVKLEKSKKQNSAQSQLQEIKAT